MELHGLIPAHDGVAAYEAPSGADCMIGSCKRKTTSDCPRPSPPIQIRYPPATMGAPPIQYARTEDGVNIAYWTLGRGSQGHFGGVYRSG